MAYGKKVKFHYDIPAYVKRQLTDTAKKLNVTATNLLTQIIHEEYERIKKEENKNKQ